MGFFRERVGFLDGWRRKCNPGFWRSGWTQAPEDGSQPKSFQSSSDSASHRSSQCSACSPAFPCCSSPSSPAAPDPSRTPTDTCQAEQRSSAMDTQWHRLLHHPQCRRPSLLVTGSADCPTPTGAGTDEASHLRTIAPGRRRTSSRQPVSCVVPCPPAASASTAKAGRAGGSASTLAGTTPSSWSLVCGSIPGGTVSAAVLAGLRRAVLPMAPS